jgi:hypothetical protein
VLQQVDKLLWKVPIKPSLLILASSAAPGLELVEFVCSIGMIGWFWFMKRLQCSCDAHDRVRSGRMSTILVRHEVRPRHEHLSKPTENGFNFASRVAAFLQIRKGSRHDADRSRVK